MRVQNADGRDERLPAPDPWIRHLAYLMDGAIPLGRWSFGIDPLLGLVPGIGDPIGALISMVIVMRAVQAGTPRIAIARMMTNIAIDTFVGSIPVLGDAFDFAYKSNLKNLRIYEESHYAGHSATARHWGFFIALEPHPPCTATAAPCAMIADRWRTPNTLGY